MMIRTALRCTILGVGLGGLCATANAGELIQVIYSEVPGHPTAAVPGARNLAGELVDTEFKALESLNFSADGTQWILESRNQLGSDLETQLLMGTGMSGEMLAQEGQPVVDGAPGEVYDFMDGVAGFNDMGHFAFGARARGGDFDTKEKVIKYDGKFEIVVQESDPAKGLEDDPGNVQGDELIGNSINSIHLLNDGSVGFVNLAIKNIHSSYRPALFYDTTAFAQSNVTPLGDSVWEDFDSDGFFTTPDGKDWIAVGNQAGSGFFGPEVLGVNGEVAILEDEPLGKDTVGGVFNANLRADGTWFARGEYTNEDVWAVRNGEILAVTGDPITTGGKETWSDSFSAVTGNRNGDWIIAGKTSETGLGGTVEIDDVVVLNGEQVVVREGDPVDLNGDGMANDDAFIGRGDPTSSAFRPDQFFLSDDGVLWFIARLRDSKGNDLGEFVGGDGFLRLDLGLEPTCPADIAENDSVVNVNDLLLLLANWGTDGPGAAIAEPNDIVNVEDLLGLLADWGPCS